MNTLVVDIKFNWSGSITFYFYKEDIFGIAMIPMIKVEKEDLYNLFGFEATDKVKEHIKNGGVMYAREVNNPESNTYRNNKMVIGSENPVDCFFDMIVDLYGPINGRDIEFKYRLERNVCEPSWFNDLTNLTYEQIVDMINNRQMFRISKPAKELNFFGYTREECNAKVARDRESLGMYGF